MDRAQVVWMAEPLVKFAAPELSAAQRRRVAAIEAEHAARAETTRRLRLQVYVLEARGLPN